MPILTQKLTAFAVGYKITLKAHMEEKWFLKDFDKAKITSEPLRGQPPTKPVLYGVRGFISIVNKFVYLRLNSEG